MHVRANTSTTHINVIKGGADASFNKHTVTMVTENFIASPIATHILQI